MNVIAILENVVWADAIPAGFAIVILGSAMVILISGIWSSRDQ